MIKAFLFDYGGVITTGGTGHELPERLGANLSITADEAFALLDPMWGDYSRGKITEDALWQSVEKRFGKPIPTTKRDIWNRWETMQPLPEMVALAQDLRTRGYQ
jgi:FMN phosphatase YigB (HAD superfamily)